ncbi:MAG: haloacid dehalogenase-like hydrolase, partial [Desulfovibrionaceae bacterium]|nr:haloacid dehalogenase-like hydrolase [Desulfovibrionaceae bacterium]
MFIWILFTSIPGARAASLNSAAPAAELISQTPQWISSAGLPEAAEALPSWADTAARQAIIKFVNAVSDPDGPDYLLPEQRIAVFDNDGTLIPENPYPFFMEYAYSRYLTASPERKKSGGANLISKELEEKGLDSAMALNAGRAMEILAGAYSGDDSVLLGEDVGAWLEQPCPHGGEERRRRDMAYLPMQELLSFLNKHQFQIYLVSEGEQEFERALARHLYNIPPMQVIGAELRYAFEEKKGRLAIKTEPNFTNINSGPGKAINIVSRLGAAPVFAAGNSDNDLEMLRLTTQAPGLRLGIIIHHTDAEREFAYDREAERGKLRRALELAEQEGWVLV